MYLYVRIFSYTILKIGECSDINIKCHVQNICFLIFIPCVYVYNKCIREEMYYNTTYINIEKENILTM